MLVELAMMHLYGVPEPHTTIVKHCDMKLDAVPLTGSEAKPEPLFLWILLE